MLAEWTARYGVGFVFALVVLIGTACAGDGDSSDDDAATPDDDVADDDADDDEAGGDRTDIPTPHDVFSSHNSVGWIVGVKNGGSKIWRDFHGVWTEEDLLIDMPMGVLAVDDIAAIDDERAVAVGSFIEQHEKYPLILERDENGWKRRELTDIECGELIAVAVSAPDDAVALCETPTQFLGYRFDGANWNPFRNPLGFMAPAMLWFTVSATGPGSYLIAGGWIPEWRAVLLEWTGNRFGVVPGAWNSIYIYEVAAVDGERFAASCSAHMPECGIYRVREPEWAEEAFVQGFVTGFSRSPGGEWYASARSGYGFAILRRIDSRWIPLLGAADADSIELTSFNDIDAPRDDLVVAVGEKHTDRSRSAASMYDGRTWRTLDAITGTGSLEWLAVSYVR